MIGINEFMKMEEPKRRSKLEPFREDIFILKKKGYSDVSIVKYLAMNGVTVSQKTVNKFIHKYSVQPDESNVVRVDESVSEKKDSTNEISGKPRQFDWQSPVDEDELI